jgi:Fe-S-cluster containining protein
MFECSKCGACCRIAGNFLKNVVHGFPYKISDTGMCEKLVGNECTVFETRPDICRSEYCYDHFFKDKITVKEYDELNVKACDLIRKIELSKGK